MDDEERLMRVFAIDSDDFAVMDFGEMSAAEAETATIDIRRSDDMNGWKDEDPWGTFAAALDASSVSDETLTATVVLVHFAERMPERWLSSNRAFRIPES